MMQVYDAQRLKSNICTITIKQEPHFSLDVAPRNTKVQRRSAVLSPNPLSSGHQIQ